MPKERLVKSKLGDTLGWCQLSVSGNSVEVEVFIDSGIEEGYDIAHIVKPSKLCAEKVFEGMTDRHVIEIIDHVAMGGCLPDYLKENY